MAEKELAADLPEEKIDLQGMIQKMELAAEKAKVSPFDPDFLIILLLVAVPFDIILAILEIIGLFAFQIPKIISIPLNLIPFIIICAWSVWRVGEIIRTREEQKKTLQKAVAKQSAALQKKLATQIAKVGTKSAVRKVLLRGAIAILGGILPIVALIPFWTITTILILREK